MSYAGQGTVKTEWQQAQNLINQQTAIIISELVEAERKIRVEKLQRQDIERALKSYKESPEAYSEGWYVKELGKARETIHKLESDVRRQQEFMRLKDQAKIKVERVRDVALRENKNLTQILDLLRSKAIAAEGMQATNEQQAIAWRSAVEEANTLRNNNQALRDEIARLLDVLRLGREGLRNETW